MMKSSPAASLIVPQPKFLFELFVATFDDPTLLLARRTKWFRVVSAERVESQYLPGSASAASHSISNHCSEYG
jgi:hypothetical protein